MSRIEYTGENKKELEEELRTHLEMLVDEYMEQGYSQTKALQCAMEDFGCPDEIGKELHKTFYYNREMKLMFPRKLIGALLVGTLGTGLAAGLLISALKMDSLSAVLLPLLALFPVSIIYVGFISSLVEFTVKRFRIKPRLIVTCLLYLLSFGASSVFAFQLYGPGTYTNVLFLSTVTALSLFIVDEWLQRKRSGMVEWIYTSFCIGVVKWTHPLLKQSI
nr:permease prefix domain 1-containing protein [Paenactinomyces guangxiensis]